jgi:SAM-dependent methyltransferase
LAGSAPQRYDRVVAPLMAPFVDALLDAGQVGPGCAVLDVACGTGFAARAAAMRVGPTGRVAGVDINPEMLAVAAATGAATPTAVASASPPPELPAIELPAVEWREASADDIPFPDAAFDAVVCQQGLQFFPDLPAAVAEAARVTRRGGRVAATVWSPLERSPYFDAQIRAVEEILGARDTASLTSAFGCSLERVAAAFRAAGLRDVTGREVVADVHLPPAAEFVPAHSSVTPWGIAAAEARPDGVQRITSSVATALAGYTCPDGSMAVPFASLLVAGCR